jgi:carbamoyltransferase
MRERMNILKRREQWRPFGPVTNADPGLWEPAGHWSGTCSAPLASPRPALAAIPPWRTSTAPHAPSASSRDEPFVHAVLDALSERGHPPVLLNTSFNGPGDPGGDRRPRPGLCPAPGRDRSGH